MRTVVKRWMANQVQPLHRDTEIVQRIAYSMGRSVMSSSDRDNRIGAGGHVSVPAQEDWYK